MVPRTASPDKSSDLLSEPGPSVSLDDATDVEITLDFTAQPASMKASLHAETLSIPDLLSFATGPLSLSADTPYSPPFLSVLVSRGLVPQEWLDIILRRQWQVPSHNRTDSRKTQDGKLQSSWSPFRPDVTLRPSESFTLHKLERQPSSVPGDLKETFTYTTDCNIDWDYGVLANCERLATEPDSDIQLVVELKHWQTEEANAAAFIYVPARQQDASTSEQSKINYVGILTTHSDADAITVDETFLALSMASGLTADLQSPDTWTWVLSRTEPSGVTGSITNEDEKDMVRRNLADEAVRRWKGDNSGCLEEAAEKYRKAVNDHLETRLKFTTADEFVKVYHRRRAEGSHLTAGEE